MSVENVPPWLADFQARFSGVLRTPLQRSTGTLRSAPERYDPVACRSVLPGARSTSRERLAVYNRQYWFRLLSVLQGVYPLLARLFGAWHFNEHAAAFLTECPPRDVELEAAATGFDAFLARHLSVDPVPARQRSLPREALLQAAHLDACWRRAFAAPAVPAFALTAAMLAELANRRLRPSPAAILLTLDWPLLRLRHQLAGAPETAMLELPPRLATPSYAALIRTSSGIASVALEADEARLLSLLQQAPLGAALARFEAECTPAERATAPERVQRWLARSVELGLWSGVD